MDFPDIRLFLVERLADKAEGPLEKVTIAAEL
jgi:hypothetical protein